MRRVHLLSDPDDSPEGIFDKTYRVFVNRYGEDEFLDLLQDLAPCLESPLTILALDNTDNRVAAMTWVVKPGSKDIETLQISL